MAGTAADTPWSDSYWPNMDGGIAYRWASSSEPRSFGYALYTLQDLQQMSLAQLKTLSPAEKYDILSDRLDFPTVRSEWRRTAPSDPDWFGLCHGWSPAAILYDEPRPVSLRAPSGLLIPFGSSDVKALLTYFLGVYASANIGVRSKSLGRRCSTPGTIACSRDDLNAGALLVLLANEIGLRHSSFNLDVDPSPQIWNQPMVGYSCANTGPQLSCSVTYAKETAASWNPHTPAVAREQYNIVLDLVGNKVVGGSYVGGRNPDFAWDLLSTPAFGGYMSTLAQLYTASISSSASSWDSGLPMNTQAVNASRVVLSTERPLYTLETEALCSPLVVVNATCTLVNTTEENDTDTTTGAIHLTNSSTGCKGSVSFSRQDGQGSSMCAMWKVFCPANATAVAVTLTAFNATSYRTAVKVYENMNGPLVAALTGATYHPELLNHPLHVPGASVRVVLEGSAVYSATPEELQFSFACLEQNGEDAV
eukprot:GGOE01054398.1.p1 GENE.GGOE01054398.1~~GGOE01054398.1.p1  ORF type:complete len:479 (-),score=110.41 GGOE01054398.1:396-1832(-)